MSTTPSRSGSTGFVTGVLSLRGLLALMVATSHTVGFTVLGNYSGSVFEQPNLRTAVLKLLGGVVNVPMIFFLISGLAIARSLERKEELGQAWRTYGIFLVRRVLRLYPAHITATLGVLVLAGFFLIGRAPLDFSAYPAAGLDEYAAEWLNGSVFNPLRPATVIANFAIASWSMNLVIWSLYVEVCAIPVLPAFHRIARGRRDASDFAAVAGLVMLSGVFGWCVAVKYWFAFYLGMLIQTRGQSFARALIRHTGSAGRASALAWLLMFVPGGWAVDWAPALFLQAGSAFAIVSLIVWREDGEAFKLLGGRWLSWNGRLSYSFYLWHYFILTVVVRALYAGLAPETMLGNDLAIFAGVEIVTVGLALAAAQFTYSYVEVPCIEWGTRLEARWRRPARVQATARPAPQGAD